MSFGIAERTGAVQKELPAACRPRSVFGSVLDILRTRTRIYPFVKTRFFDRSKSYYEFDSRFYEDEALLDRCVRKIVRIGNQCRQRGMAFDLFLLPYEYQLRKPADALEPQNRFKNKLEKAGVEVCDPAADILSRHMKSRDLFLYGDRIHLSKAGHRIMAGSVREKIR
ncbi:hypothetical protein JW906_05345 [bacterium]|nr:hypothetical protein [bacterium]